MDDDLRRAAEVVEWLVQLLYREDPGLRAGSMIRLNHRDCADRFVVNVRLDDAGELGPLWVDVEGPRPRAGPAIEAWEHRVAPA